MIMLLSRVCLLKGIAHPELKFCHHFQNLMLFNSLCFHLLSLKIISISIVQNDMQESHKGHYSRILSELSLLWNNVCAFLSFISIWLSQFLSNSPFLSFLFLCLSGLAETEPRQVSHSGSQESNITPPSSFSPIWIFPDFIIYLS